MNQHMDVNINENVAWTESMNIFYFSGHLWASNGFPGETTTRSD